MGARPAPRRWLHDARGSAAGVAATLLLIWVGITVHLAQQYDDATVAAGEQAGTFARAFEQSIERAFDGIDQTLLFVRESYQRDPAHFDLTAWARNRQFTSGWTFQVGVIDADGIVVASNLGPVTSRIDLSDREHVRVQKLSKDDRPFISVPVIGRVSGKPSLNVSRKMIGPDGRYAGAVVVSVDPYAISRFYESLEIGNGVVSLVGADGVVRARAPAAAASLGRHISAQLAAAMFSGAESGTFTNRSSIDNTERLIAFRRVPDYPLYVLMGLDLAEVYAPYRREMLQYVVGGGFLSALVLGAGAVLTRQRRRLVRSRLLLSATLENIGQGIVMADAGGRVQVMNARAATLLGLPRELVRARPTYAEILRWQLEHGEFAPLPAEQARVAPDADHAIYQCSRGDGTVLAIHTRHLPDGGTVRTYTDITEQRAAEAALAASCDAAETAGRARSEFLAVMGQEIRAPLNGIIGAARLLAEAPLAATEQAHVRSVLDSGNHLARLLDDVLDVARLDTGRLELDEASFDIREAARATLDLLGPAARAKGLDLTLSVAEDVPGHAGGDVRRLRQALLNLLGNGIKFTSDGNVRLAITRLPAPKPAGEARPDREAACVRLRFAVSDTGIGIAPDVVTRLSASGDGPGRAGADQRGSLGLGLAIARRLIERMGGTLTVDSAPGVGSTVRFDLALPLRQAVDAAEMARADATDVGAALRQRLARSDMRAATADDEAEAHAGAASGLDRTVLAGLVRDLGAAPAAELVRLFSESAPAAVAECSALARDGQLGALSLHARSLARTARTVGLTSVADACLEFDAAAAQGADALASLLARLAADLASGMRALAAWQPVTTDPA